MSEEAQGPVPPAPSSPQVRITKQLTLDRTVDPKDIAILTPYNAQAALIIKDLQREGITGVTVSSITKSQGEADSGGGRTWLGSGGVQRGRHELTSSRERVALCAGEHRSNMS
jgi:hypothetical protein